MTATDTEQEPIVVYFAPCGCGVLVGEECDCVEFAAQLRTAPVIRMGGESR